MSYKIKKYSSISFLSDTYLAHFSCNVKFDFLFIFFKIIPFESVFYKLLTTNKKRKSSLERRLPCIGFDCSNSCTFDKIENHILPIKNSNFPSKTADYNTFCQSF